MYRRFGAYSKPVCWVKIRKFLYFLRISSYHRNSVTENIIHFKTMTLKLQYTLKNATSPWLLEPKLFSHQCIKKLTLTLTLNHKHGDRLYGDKSTLKIWFFNIFLMCFISWGNVYGLPRCVVPLYMTFLLHKSTFCTYVSSPPQGKAVPVSTIQAKGWSFATSVPFRLRTDLHQ